MYGMATSTKMIPIFHENMNEISHKYAGYKDDLEKYDRGVRATDPKQATPGLPLWSSKSGK